MRHAFLRRLARPYVAGPTLDHAVALARAWATAGVAATLCYWDSGRETAEAVAAAALATAVAARGLERAQVSVKLPPLAGRPELVEPLLGEAPLLFDAITRPMVDGALTLADRLGGGDRLGVALVARHPTSGANAERAARLGIRVRVVKGQSRAAGDLEPRRAFLDLVDRLCGRVPLVHVATHDLPLLRTALERLAAASTPAEVELLLGLPLAEPLAAARDHGVPVRLYIPWGHPWLPYGLGDVPRRPRVVLWAARDAVRRAALPEGVGAEMQRYFGPRAVDEYAARTALFPGERPFVHDLERRRARRLLDVGVGAGRTTAHFAQLADEYVGVDLSPAMVDACRSRFPEHRFEVADVRSLASFEDGAFDVVLFSHNGIDTVGGDADRRLAFAELRRVCAPGGRLLFSSKNLNQVPDELRLSTQLRRALDTDGAGPLPVRLAKAAARFGRARVLNPPVARLVAAGGGLVADDREGTRILRHYHVRPDAQVRRLHELGFAEVEVYGADGEPVPPERLTTVRGDFLHYLCRLP